MPRKVGGETFLRISINKDSSTIKWQSNKSVRQRLGQGGLCRKESDFFMNISRNY